MMGVRAAAPFVPSVVPHRSYCTAVYGIPWEQCQAALQRSQEAVSKGFPASWPDLQCANVSYSGPDASYAHVLDLAQGAHTLHTGLFTLVSSTRLQGIMQSKTG